MLSFAANCALLCALALVSRAPTMQRALLLALCAYGAFLVRPDNGLYMLLVPTLYLLLILRCGRRITIGFVATLVALLLVDGAAKWIVFGDPMPLSFYVKATGFYDGYAGGHKWNPVREVVDFTLATSPLWGAMVLTAKRCDWRYLAVFLAPLVVTFTYFSSVVQITGSFYRFYLPSFAFLVVLAIVLLDRWWLDGRRRSLGAGFAARVGLIAAAIGRARVRQKRPRRGLRESIPRQPHRRVLPASFPGNREASTPRLVAKHRSDDVAQRTTAGGHHHCGIGVWDARSHEPDSPYRRSRWSTRSRFRPPRVLDGSCGGGVPGAHLVPAR